MPYPSFSIPYQVDTELDRACYLPQYCNSSCTRHTNNYGQIQTENQVLQPLKHQHVCTPNPTAWCTSEVCLNCSSKLPEAAILCSFQSLNTLFIRIFFLISGSNLHCYYLNPLLHSQLMRAGQASVLASIVMYFNHLL